MYRIAVLDDYARVAKSVADWQSLGEGVQVDSFAEHVGGLDNAAAVLKDYDILCLMRERMPLPAELIDRLPNLKLVVYTGKRNQKLDLAATQRRNIVVCHTEGGEESAVELAWGLLLCLARNIPEEDQRMKAGGWQQTYGLSMRDRTLGILGLGKHGTRMASIGRSFGMKVIAWSQNLTKEKAAEHSVLRVEKEELLSQSDAISIHLVLSDRTRGLLGRKELAMMKQGAMLINTSRGPIVDEAALVEALQSQRIKAGLDVFDTEPLPANHPLRSCPNVILSPHLGYVTEGTLRGYYQSTVEVIRAWQSGRPTHVVSPA